MLQQICCRKQDPRTRRGFTLIEIAVFMIVVGALTAAAVSFAIPTIKSARIIETQSKLRNIQTALHAYVMTNYRLPCAAFPNRTPAAFPNDPPFGFERGSGPNGDQIPANCAFGDSSGVVPFATLGLSEEDVVDGWGNFISYHVSPAFSRDPADDTLSVFAQCRTADWMYEVGTDFTQLRNRSPVKARFCCPGNNPAPNTDWVIVDENNTPALAGAGAGAAFTSRSGNGALYATADTSYPNPMVPNSFVPATDKATGIAFVLVSHGESNGGAFNVRTGNRFPFREAVNFDSENDSGDRVLVKPTQPSIRAGGALVSDDQIIWDTQETIMSAIGQSCALP